MIVTIHQPEHLPWLGFFDKMRQADVFIFLDNTQFSKNGFQNRNRIKTSTGSTWLTVPVYTSGRSKQLIQDTEISNVHNWRHRNWDLMFQNYKIAPYFDEHRLFFQEVFDRRWTKLIEINLTIIEYLVEQLGLKTQLVKSSELGIQELGATRVVLRLCQEFRADVYLSGKHGRDYLDETPFREHGISVKYQEFHHPMYPQQWGEFVCNMSTVDLLFNCGQSSLEIITRANSLKKCQCKF